MHKGDVIAFFDSRAAEWDNELIKSDQKINLILDNAGIQTGIDVLDVACGTGVLIPYYLERQVKSVTAIDISSEMIKVAEQKFQQSNVYFICGDVEETAFDHKFDCIMIYNAFPHFPDPERLIHNLSMLLKDGGTLTVAHGMSRAQIDHRHQGSAAKISMGLMHETDLAAIFEKSLTVCTIISNDDMYQVTGKN